MPVREDEWLREIDRLTRLHVDGFTTGDVAEATGMSHRRVREKIAQAIRLGVLVFAGRRTATSIDDKSCKVPVYRKAAKAKPKRA